MLNKRYVLSLIIGMSIFLVSCHAKKSHSTEKESMQVNKSIVEHQRIKKISTDAPIAKRVENIRTYHGNELKDSYFWLKDPDYPKTDDVDVLNYLKAENAYYYEFLKPHQKFADKIFKEFKDRTDETEESVPYIENGYEYRSAYKEGNEYPIHSRKNLQTGTEEVFLDENALAEGKDYYVIGDFDISPDNRFLVYSFDTAGDERYQATIKDLQTGKYLDDVLEDVQGELLFSKDGKSIVYALLEKDRWHAKHIKVHTIGETQAKDKTLYEEKDPGYFIGFGLTSDQEYFLITSSQGENQESYVAPADFSSELIQITSRNKGFTQDIDHAHGHFYILANDTHKNGRLVKVSDEDPRYENWETLQAGSNDVYFLDIQTFKDFLVIKSRNSGLDNLQIRNYDNSSHSISFPEEVFRASISTNPEFTQDFLRVSYESMITPDTIFDYSLSDKSLTTRKVQKIPAGYDKSQYVSERVMAPARDGALIPVSIVYKKGFKKDASQPMWLYGYGAYAATISPSFSTMRLSALDRGFSFAVAHVRGGSMMSYQWYLDGKLKKRMNTFNDFVDVAQHLVKEKYVAAGNISASGRSAGGELMGAVTIQAPDLWRSINLGVPFVDVLNTMLDASLPLTPPEWKEWGNPIESAEDYELIQSYSPYDQITNREYPPMFVSGGLNDPRVTYWEPAKWTAKMRHLKTDDNLLVMRINMGAGHFSNSGRYGRLKDYAEEYAFMFLAHGITE